MKMKNQVMDKICKIIYCHFKNCLTIMFNQKLNRNCEIQVKMENLKFELIPIVIIQIPNKIILSSSI